MRTDIFNSIDYLKKQYSDIYDDVYKIDNEYKNKNV